MQKNKTPTNGTETNKRKRRHRNTIPKEKNPEHTATEGGNPENNKSRRRTSTKETENRQPRKMRKI